MTDYYSEAHHVTTYCLGEAHYGLTEGSTADCVTSQYAQEYDWAPKWAECIGQALYYAEITGLEASCVLIVKSKSRGHRYIYRFNEATKHAPVKLFVINADEM